MPVFGKHCIRAITGHFGVNRRRPQISRWFPSLLFVLSLLAVFNARSILTALGAGGVVLGFALRNLFADIFTGLAINIDRTFQIGEWVQINEGLAEPTVAQIREIGWRCSNLVTEEQMTVVVPNGMLGLERVINISRPIEPTRFELNVTVEYSVPDRRVKRVLLAALKSLTEQPPELTAYRRTLSRQSRFQYSARSPLLLPECR